MKLGKLVAVMALLVCFGCSSTRNMSLTTQSSGLYYSKLPERPYQEMAYVEATGSIFTSRQHLTRKLQQEQARSQGDALIQVRHDFVFWWPHASAIVVKYQ